MELKPGYKQTEVGSIPADWNVTPLDQCLSRPPRYGINAAAVPFDDTLPTYIRITDISEDGRFVPTPKVSVAHREATEYLLNDGDLVFARTGASVGKSYCYDPSDGVLVFAGFLIQITPDINQIRPRLLKQYVQTAAYWNWVATMSTRSGQPGINGQEYGTLLLPLPPTTDEQVAIATALSDVDALLEGLDRLIAKKRDLKQSVMQQLLTGDTRLPGFTGEWNSLNMGRQSYLKARIGWQGLTTAEYLESGDYGLVTGTDFREGRIDWGGCHFVEKSRYDQDRFIQLKVGDVLVTKDGTIGKAAYIDHLPFPTTLNSGVFVMRPLNDSYVPKYFFYILMSRIFTDFLNKLAAGSTISHLYQKDFVGFEFSAPSTNKEQSAIVEVLSDMDSEIEALEQRRAKTADLKQAMMQELLTGKTRLFEPQASDEQAEAASSNAKGHNWAINEAVVIATLVKHFGGENYPLGRKRYTKLSYLLHRHVEREADGYLKKAAGPYNPQTKYGGPEKIAKQNGYITQHKGPKGHSGFIAADNIAQAEGYFEKWYGPEVIQWLEQFRYKKNDDLEVLATVDMAALELRASGKSVTVAAVKDVITSHPEWEAKLDRAAFSDANIAEAIKQSDALLGAEIAGGSHA